MAMTKPTSEQVTFTQAGTGAVTRTAQAKMRDVVSVKDFGAVGDGVTDDTAAIQAAIDYAQATSGIRNVEFPTATYKITAKIDVKGSFLYGLILAGNRSTIISTHNGIAFDCDATGAPGTRIYLTIRDLNVVGPGAASTSSVGIQMYGAGFYLDNVLIYGYYKALYGKGCLISNFNNCTFTYSHFGIFFESFNIFSPNDIAFSKCNIIQNNRAIKYVDFDYGVVTFNACEIEANNTGGNATDGVAVCEFSQAGEVNLIGCHFEAQPGQYNIYFDSPNGRHLNIIGGKIIPGDTAGSCVYVGYGELFVTGSHIAQNVGNNINLSSNCGSAIVIGETAGSVTGTLTKLTRVSQGRVRTGGATGSSAGVHAKNSATGIGVDVEGTLRFVDASNNRLGYQTYNDMVLDASAAYRIITGYGSIYFMRTGQQVEPGGDNTYGLGSAALRWSTVYAGTGTINTSDERAKQDIAVLDAAEKRVATALKGLIKKFRFKDAVQAKGDGARIHVGVIAQEVIAAFQAESLDPMRYGIICYDQWDAEDDLPAGDRYGVRYEQLLAFIIAAL